MSEENQAEAQAARVRAAAEKWEIGRQARRAVTETAKLGLPLPRLQLTWFDSAEINKKYCSYDLLIPVDVLDIRCNDEEGHVNSGEHQTFAICHQGVTKCEVMAKDKEFQVVHRNGNGEYLGTPFRDGVHMNRDREILKFPAFTVYGGKVDELKDAEQLKRY